MQNLAIVIFNEKDSSKAITVKHDVLHQHHFERFDCEQVNLTLVTDLTQATLFDLT